MSRRSPRASRRQEPVTISEVAAAAGVARSSVSRAFTKPHLLSAGTVSRIRETAARLGYVPNPYARGLSTGRSGNIGMILPDVANPFFPPMIRAAQDAADLSELCVFLGNSNEDPAQEQRLASRFTSQVDGLILASSRMAEEEVRALAAQRPVVLINRDLDGLPRVLIDAVPGMRSAAQYLAALGHRRVAYVSGPSNSWSNTARQQALETAAEEFGLELVVLCACVPSFEAGEAMAEPFLAAGATVAIAFDDLTAHGLMKALGVLGVAVPQDVSIVGCDDVLGRLTTPGLTSIANRSAEAGRHAVALLSDLLYEASGQETRVVLPADLVIRKSTGPAVAIPAA
ncbi:MAG: LacI family DNA-binding transcriptional regulator [Pseudomonadota bacterium]